MDSFARASFKHEGTLLHYVTYARKVILHKTNIQKKKKRNINCKRKSRKKCKKFIEKKTYCPRVWASIVVIVLLKIKTKRKNNNKKTNEK